MKERAWHKSVAPAYVGDPKDCGLTIMEHATIEMAKSVYSESPKSNSAEIADKAFDLAKAVLNRVWKDQN